jgi:hypothetical protein
LKKCRDKRKDLKGVGIVIARLSDPSNILRGDIKNVWNISPQAKDFISRLSTASYATIFEVSTADNLRIISDAAITAQVSGAHSL